MMKRLVGIILGLVGISLYGGHLAERGSQPHLLLTLLGGGVVLYGLWLALPGHRRGG